MLIVVLTQWRYTCTQAHFGWDCSGHECGYFSMCHPPAPANSASSRRRCGWDYPPEKFVGVVIPQAKTTMHAHKATNLSKLIRRFYGVWEVVVEVSVDDCARTGPVQVVRVAHVQVIAEHHEHLQSIWKRLSKIINTNCHQSVSRRD